MKKQIVATVLAMAASAALAKAQYQWTGAVSSDFADAGNWLVNEGGAWVATETPPQNVYGEDTVIFDGDAEACPHQPEISTDYMIRDLFFRTSGWTIGGTGSLRLNHCFGGTDYRVGGVQRPNITIAVTDSSTSGTNTIAVAFKVTYGYTFDVAEGATVAITGVTSVDNGPGNNLGSNAKHSRKQGAGTLYLGGVGTADRISDKYVDVAAGTLALGRVNDSGDGVACMGGNLHVNGTGRVIFEAANQVADDKANWWMLADEGTIDFGGYKQVLGKIALGVRADVAKSPTAWHGEILNASKMYVGTANSGSSAYGNLLVTKENPETMRITNGLMSECGRYNGIGGNSMWFYVADNPDLDVELSIEGSIYEGRTGNLGVPVIFTGADPVDSESRGAVALSCINGSAGQYARVHVRTTVYVNETVDGLSSLGNPREVNVSKAGCLRGDGLVKIATAKNQDPDLDIYGELAPGSLANPSATLTFDRTATNYSLDWTMHTNAVFRLEADRAGALPSVEQKQGKFILEHPATIRAALEAANAALEEGAVPVDVDAALAGIVAPKIVVSGKNAPAAGTHRVLSVTGTLSGEFAPEVELDFPKSSSYTVTPIYSKSADGKTAYVDLKVRKNGMVLLVM